MSEQIYSISELARLANVTVRTIRYYISEGLLPPPGMGSQSDRYDDSYLKRLELIKRLKSEYLPLDKIRELLTKVGEETIHQEVQQTPAPEEKPDSAREYLQALLHPDRTASLNQRLTSKLRATLPGTARSSTVSSIPAPKELCELPSSQATTGVKWNKYQYGNDIELHVRECPHSPAFIRRLARVKKDLEALSREYEHD